MKTYYGTLNLMIDADDAEAATQELDVIGMQLTNYERVVNVTHEGISEGDLVDQPTLTAMQRFEEEVKARVHMAREVLGEDWYDGFVAELNRNR